MDALTINKYIKVNMLYPYNLNEDEYDFEFSWGTSDISYPDGERITTRSMHFIVYKTFGKHKEAIATFTFFRDKYKNNNFILADYNVLNRYYSETQKRYFNLFLPLDPIWVFAFKYKIHIKNN